MRLIASFDQHKLGFRYDNDVPISRIRKTARVVMFNAGGQLALMHLSVIGSYKIPGGDIDGSESAQEALRREVQEEAGYSILNIRTD